MDVDLNSRYVTLLNKFCRENDFFPPVFKLMSKWGVGGAVRVRVSASSCSREAAAATEMEAREIAAERIYKYLLQRSPQVSTKPELVSTIKWLVLEQRMCSVNKYIITVNNSMLPSRHKYIFILFLVEHVK